MSDTTLNRFLSSGTHAQRLAFTPTQATPASGPSPTAFWFETDTGNAYAWNFGTSAWVLLPGSSGGTAETEFGIPPAINPNSAVVLTTGFFFSKAIVAERTGTINSIKLYATAAQAGNQVTPGVYSNTSSNTIGTLLSAASQITGVAQGLNKYSLTSGAAVTKGTSYWIGFSIQNGGGTIASLAATAVHANMIAFFANTGVLPGTAPAASYAGTWGTFWASADT